MTGEHTPIIIFHNGTKLNVVKEEDIRSVIIYCCEAIVREFPDCELQYKYDFYDKKWLIVYTNVKYKTSKLFNDYVKKLQDEIKDCYNISILIMYLSKDIRILSKKFIYNKEKLKKDIELLRR